jgi:hypothetical protein
MFNEHDYEKVKNMITAQIQEDVGRGKCVQDIVNLCKKLEKDMEDLIEKHIMKFHGRKPTQEEDYGVRLLVSSLLNEERIEKEEDE